MSDKVKCQFADKCTDKICDHRKEHKAFRDEGENEVCTQWTSFKCDFTHGKVRCIAVKKQRKSMRVYDLHSPKDCFWSSAEPQSLEDIINLAKSFGLDMIKCSIPDGLNDYERSHPTKAVIFDVTSEDVVMVEKEN